MAGKAGMEGAPARAEQFCGLVHLATGKPQGRHDAFPLVVQLGSGRTGFEPAEPVPSDAFPADVFPGKGVFREGHLSRASSCSRLQDQPGLDDRPCRIRTSGPPRLRHIR